MHYLIKLIISLALPLVIGFAGSISTTSEIDTWYFALEKPSFSPPNWLFGPVWTILYLCMGIAMYLVWIKDGLSTIPAYFAQLALNAAWSPVFFSLHVPLAALAIIIALWAAIAMTIMQMKVPAARTLMIPYLLWVTFAAALNLAIVLLN